MENSKIFKPLQDRMGMLLLEPEKILLAAEAILLEYRGEARKDKYVNLDVHFKGTADNYLERVRIAYFLEDVLRAEMGNRHLSKLYPVLKERLGDSVDRYLKRTGEAFDQDRFDSLLERLEKGALKSYLKQSFNARAGFSAPFLTLTYREELNKYIYPSFQEILSDYGHEVPELLVSDPGHYAVLGADEPGPDAHSGPDI